MPPPNFRTITLPARLVERIDALASELATEDSLRKPTRADAIDYLLICRDLDPVRERKPGRPKIKART